MRFKPESLLPKCAPVRGLAMRAELAAFSLLTPKSPATARGTLDRRPRNQADSKRLNNMYTIVARVSASLGLRAVLGQLQL